MQPTNSLLRVAWLILLSKVVQATTTDPLAYRDIAGFVAANSENITTILDFINSRSDLSSLATGIGEVGGFLEAFNTTPDWSFTFFAPNNDAFESHTGEYFNTFQATPKGKWQLGNTILHHYVPNTKLPSSVFNSTYRRIQTATFLYVGTQVENGTVVLNRVANVLEKDIPVTNGVVHIIDRILDPSAQIFEADLPKISQTFIPGSCSNMALSYC